jgi:hypothetical protein
MVVFLARDPGDVASIARRLCVMAGERVPKGQRDGVWKRCAAKLGWYWSPAHNGYIHEGQRSQGYGWDSYRVEEDVENACFISGIPSGGHGQGGW